MPVRYAVSALQTLGVLLLRRPRAIIATNPPIFLGLIGWAYGRSRRIPVVLDSHPGGFGLQGDRVSARLVPLLRWLVPRVAAVLVTDDQLAGRVRDWGGRAILVHEAPPSGALEPARPPGERPQVLFVGTFGRDEPVDAVVEAARRRPELDVLITGDLAKAPPGMVAGAPSNVSWLGFLPTAAYEQALAKADVVVALTTEPTSVVRAGYEAVYAGRPLVVSDTPNGRAVFPDAVHVGNDAEALAAGLAEAVRRHGELRSAAPRARERQQERWDRQLAATREVLSL